jgi:hypothetical protein
VLALTLSWSASRIDQWVTTDTSVEADLVLAVRGGSDSLWTWAPRRLKARINGPEKES